jgi:hypothetical protein
LKQESLSVRWGNWISNAFHSKSLSSWLISWWNYVCIWGWQNINQAGQSHSHHHLSSRLESEWNAMQMLWERKEMVVITAPKSLRFNYDTSWRLIPIDTERRVWQGPNGVSLQAKLISASSQW